MAMQSLDAARINRAKRAFTTRRADVSLMNCLITGNVKPASGDLVLARIDEIGKQTRLELTDGRRAHLFPGDEIIACFGNRYAPDQFEAVIGPDLRSCDLIAAGGIASREISRNLRMPPPTQITPIGLIADNRGRRLNLRQFGVPDSERNDNIPVVLCLGTSMNAGKTLAATSIVRGLKLGGFRVAALKVTGTGSGGDTWIVRDAGADVVLDFTDAGLASTYLIPADEIESAAQRLISHAARSGCDIAVVEIADGLEHVETATLVQADYLWRNSVGVVFAAYDAMGAKCGVDMLQAFGHRVLALSGRLALSPLGMREAQRATGLRVYTPWELQEGAINNLLMEHSYKIRPKNTALNSAGSTTYSVGAARESEHMQVDITEVEKSQGQPKDGSSETLAADLSNLPSVNQALRFSQSKAFRDLLRLVAERVMSIEANALCGIGSGVRGSKRLNYRNGYRRRQWATALGPIELKVPILRKGSYRPTFLERSEIEQNDLTWLARGTVSVGDVKTWLVKLLSSMRVGGLSEEDLMILSSDIHSRLSTLNLSRRIVPGTEVGVEDSIEKSISASKSVHANQFGSEGPNDSEIPSDFLVSPTSVDAWQLAGMSKQS